MCLVGPVKVSRLQRSVANLSNRVIWEAHTLPKNTKHYLKYWQRCYKIIAITQGIKNELVNLGLNENKILIRLLADQGHLEEALSICNKAIASYKLAPGLYFLRASILQEMDKGGEAIKSLKQAIYIDPEYIMGHFTLGNLFFHH